MNSKLTPFFTLNIKNIFQNIAINNKPYVIFCYWNDILDTNNDVTQLIKNITNSKFCLDFFVITDNNINDNEFEKKIKYNNYYIYNSVSKKNINLFDTPKIDKPYLDAKKDIYLIEDNRIIIKDTSKILEILEDITYTLYTSLLIQTDTIQIYLITKTLSKELIIKEENIFNKNLEIIYISNVDQMIKYNKLYNEFNNKIINEIID